MNLRPTATRLIAGALFVGGFLLVWQPLRSAVAVHVIESIASAATDLPVEAIGSPPTVRVNVSGREVSYSLPAGIHLLIPGLLLVLVAPTRPYWLLLWVALLVLGLVGFGFFLGGLAGFEPLFVAADFLQSYIVPPVSMGLALLFLSQHRGERRPR